MKVNYFREMKEHHMVITAGEYQCPEYQMKMVLQNPMEGVVIPVMRQMDGETLYDYCITGCQSVKAYTQTTPVQEELLRVLIETLADVIDRMESYMVDGNYLSLDPEFIFMEGGKDEKIRIKFCFFPFLGSVLTEEIRELLKYGINEVDYQDKAAVKLAYDLYQEAYQEPFQIRNLYAKVGNTRSAIAGEGQGAEGQRVKGQRVEGQRAEGQRPEEQELIDERGQWRTEQEGQGADCVKAPDGKDEILWADDWAEQRKSGRRRLWQGLFAGKRKTGKKAEAGYVLQVPGIDAVRDKERMGNHEFVYLQVKVIRPEALRRGSRP